jgi:hypothetical protein
MNMCTLVMMAVPVSVLVCALWMLKVNHRDSFTLFLLLLMIQPKERMHVSVGLDSPGAVLHTSVDFLTLWCNLI